MLKSPIVLIVLLSVLVVTGCSSNYTLTKVSKLDPGTLGNPPTTTPPTTTPATPITPPTAPAEPDPNPPNPVAPPAPTAPTTPGTPGAPTPPSPTPAPTPTPPIAAPNPPPGPGVQLIYVDAQTGNDSNAGTLALPVRTLQAGINVANKLNSKGIATSVEVGAGVYREAVDISGNEPTATPMTIEAMMPGTAAIAASDVLTGWSPESATVYSHAWTQNLGTCAIPEGWPTTFAPIAQHVEMVFVDGVALSQVMSKAQLQPGTFYVDDSARALYVSPDAATDMTTATIEAATRTKTLTMENRSNVTLRGLVFRHAADCFNTSSASITGSTNVLIDSVQAVWNNFGGLGVSGSSNVTVQNSIASYNGGTGFMAFQDENTTFTSNESDYNNWRSAQAAFYDWAMGGTKMFQMRTATVTNHMSYNNHAQGLWFDTDNKNVVIDNATLSGNVLAALQLERNEGPITIENSRLCSSGVGVNVLTSENVTVQSNTFYNNSGTNKYQAQVFVGGDTGGISVSDWQTGAVYHLLTKNMVLTGNTSQDAGTGQLLFGTYLTGSDWSQFHSTLTAGNNQWYDPATQDVFKITNGQFVDLSQWKTAVGTDLTSQWQVPSTSPAAPCASPAPAYPDFAVDLDNDAYTMTGGTAVVTVRVNSYDYGPVSLQTSSLPAGITASLSQKTLVSGVVTLTIKAASNAAAQRVPITLAGSSGSRVHTATFYVQVSPA